MPSLNARRTLTVVPADCASQWGNDGLDVLSTPAILGHMEQLCVDALKPYLRQGEMTVGTEVSLRHVAPTPAGDQVTFEVTGDPADRKITLAFRVTDAGGRLLSEGTHHRAVVDEAAFRSRLTARQPA